MTDETPHARARTRGARGRPPTSWRKPFLDALAKMANVRAACEIAGVSRQTAYRTRLESQTFARQWDEAIEQACDRLEEEAWRRSVEGVEKPVFGNQGGDQDTGQVGVILEYSDRMLEMLLKAHRPEKYRERYDVTRTPESDIDREIRDLTEKLNRWAREMGV